MNIKDEIIDYVFEDGRYYQITSEEDPYKWNGEYLGTFIYENILMDITDPTTKVKYWMINFFGHRTVCSYQSSRDTSICIYDELMSIFNFPKMGSHYIIYNNKIYIIEKARMKNASILSELPLSNVYITDEYIMDKIRNLYIIRDILGISKTGDHDIIYRTSSNNTVPDYVIGMKTYLINNNVLQNDISTITDTARKKWFMDTNTGYEIDIRKLYRNIFYNIKNIDDISHYISMFKNKLDDIIDRIDKRYCYISDLISKRLTDRLILMLDS